MKQLKKRDNIIKTVTYKLSFIDSFRFMSTSLPDLVDNFIWNFKNRLNSIKRKKKCHICIQTYWS